MFKGCYRITLKGNIKANWSEWFDRWTVSYTEPDITVLQSGIVDQSALHGVIQKIRDLNLPIISVERVSEPERKSPVDNKQKGVN